MGLRRGALFQHPNCRAIYGLLAYAEAINGKTQGDTTLVVTEGTNGRFMPLWVLIEATAVTDTTQPTINVGTNASAYDNLLSGIVIPFTTANYYYWVEIANQASQSGGKQSLSAVSTLVFRVATAATGTGSSTLNVYVFGAYVN